jgi:hypothetical protein
MVENAGFLHVANNHWTTFGKCLLDMLLSKNRYLGEACTGVAWGVERDLKADLAPDRILQFPN